MNVTRDIVIMHQAIRRGNMDEIFWLIQKKKVDLNAIVKNDHSVLHSIIENQNFRENSAIELFQIFLDRGVNPNIQNSKNETVLEIAVMKRWKDVVDILIRYHAKISKFDLEGNTIAHLFVVQEHKKFLELLQHNDNGHGVSDYMLQEIENEGASFTEWLVMKGFDFDYQNKRGISALHLSMLFNLQHISLVLLKHTRHINFVDQFGKTLLHIFIESNWVHRNEYGKHDWHFGHVSRYAIKIVNLLLERGLSTAIVDTNGLTCIQTATMYREDINIIKILVEYSLTNCEPIAAISIFMTLSKSCDRWGESSIEYFIIVLSILILKGADVNAEDESGKNAIYYAFFGGNQRAIEFLNECNANFAVITRNGENLFHALAQTDKQLTSCEVYKTLFQLIASKRCCDVNAKNTLDDTPIHFAVRQENLTLVGKLIENGAEVNCKNSNGQTPIHLAAQYNESQDITALLLENGANIYAKNNEGRRPLHLAMNRGRLVEVLLKWGAYVNDHVDNRSPFIQAIQCGQSLNARTMLEYGAEINDQRLINIISSKKILLDITYLFRHWIKLKAAGLPYSKEYEAFVNHFSSNVYEGLYNVCLKEIENLKSTFIDTRTSIFTFLHLDFESRRCYINNVELIAIVNSPDIQIKFPQYFVLILASYREAVARTKLLMQAIPTWFPLTKIALPNELVAMIYAYLENEELLKLIE